jgi:D-sedoheptulose 7-phosphate isomerase
MTTGLSAYADRVAELLASAETTSGDGHSIKTTATVQQLAQLARETHARGKTIIFIGNGGSAAIASHMATDYSKNGHVRARAFNDASMLTCLGNDLGYDRVFADQMEMHARAGDLVFAISSSGRSPNILAGVQSALAAGCTVVTLSGFEPGNPLRRMGAFNFYIASNRYGFVEIAHLTICHAILDLICDLPFSS